MDFWESDDLAAHRDTARAWADANVRGDWAGEQQRSGCHQTMDLHTRLARDGILGAGWPAEYGGSDVDPGFAQAVFDELARRGLQSDGWSTTAMVTHTIAHVATEEQKRAYIPAALDGEMLIALGYSEPDSGSDVAAAKTTAVRDGQEWVINGQKMFTSTAQLASHVFVLARTDPDALKHKGLTLFLVPTSSAGYEIQPIHTLGGQVTNATFYADVRVPDAARIGGVDAGWGVMKVALVYERGVGTTASMEQTLARDLATWARETKRPDGSTVFDDPLTAERIGRIAVDEAIFHALDLQTRWRRRRASSPRSRAPCGSCSGRKAPSGTTATPSTSSAPKASWPRAQRTPRSAENSNMTSGRRSSLRSTAAPARSSGRSSPNGASACPATGLPADASPAPRSRGVATMPEVTFPMRRRSVTPSFG